MYVVDSKCILSSNSLLLAKYSANDCVPDIITLMPNLVISSDSIFDHSIKSLIYVIS